MALHHAVKAFLRTHGICGLTWQAKYSSIIWPSFQWVLMHFSGEMAEHVLNMNPRPPKKHFCHAKKKTPLVMWFRSCA